MTTCRHPDRDVPKLLCGYPLPCPWHTVVIDTEKRTVTMPFESDALMSPARGRVGEVARALGEKTKTKRPSKARRRR